MPILVTCPHCGFRGNLPEAHIGKKIKCRGCSQPFTAAADVTPSEQGEEPAILPAPTVEAIQTTAPETPPLVPAEPETKACPLCGEQILAVARKCKHCGEMFDIQPRAVPSPASLPIEKVGGVRRGVGLGFGAIFGILAAILVILGGMFLLCCGGVTGIHQFGKQAEENAKARSSGSELVAKAEPLTPPTHTIPVSPEPRPPEVKPPEPKEEPKPEPNPKVDPPVKKAAEPAYLAEWRRAAVAKIRDLDNRALREEKRLQAMREHIELAKKGRISIGVKPGLRSKDGQDYYLFPNEASKSSSIDKMEKEAADTDGAISRMKSESEELGKTGYIVPNVPANTLKLGSAGIIIDNNDQPIVAEIFQVIDAGNVIVKIHGTLFWLQVGTKGLTDNKAVRLARPYEVADTKTYGTAIGGSKTVFVLRPVPLP